MIQHSAHFVPYTNWHVNRLSDKTFVETSSFFSPMHSIQNNKTPKSTPHISSKIIHKMFALFEGISNQLLVLSSLLLVFHS